MKMIIDKISVITDVSALNNLYGVLHQTSYRQNFCTIHSTIHCLFLLFQQVMVNEASKI